MATANSAFAGKTSLSALFTTLAKPAGAEAIPRQALPSHNEDTTSWLKRTIAEANALTAGDLPDAADQSLAPVVFSTGEAAIAVGWSYIYDLESSLSAVNGAIDALNSNAAAIARSHFGDEIGNRVGRLHEIEADAAKYRLEYRISSISHTFSVAGTLIEMACDGDLAMGSFTLSYDDGNFAATVGTDQHAWISHNGTTRPVSVRQVTADFASGKLSL